MASGVRSSWLASSTESGAPRFDRGLEPGLASRKRLPSLRDLIVGLRKAAAADPAPRPRRRRRPAFASPRRGAAPVPRTRQVQPAIEASSRKRGRNPDEEQRSREFATKPLRWSEKRAVTTTKLSPRGPARRSRQEAGLARDAADVRPGDQEKTPARLSAAFGRGVICGFSSRPAAAWWRRCGPRRGEDLGEASPRGRGGAAWRSSARSRLETSEAISSRWVRWASGRSSVRSAWKMR